MGQKDAPDEYCQEPQGEDGIRLGKSHTGNKDDVKSKYIPFPKAGEPGNVYLSGRTFQLLQPVIAMSISFFPMRVGLLTVGILFLFHCCILSVGGETLTF